MTDTIGVDLQAKGNIAAEAGKASAAMAELAKNEAKVQKIAKALGTKDIKSVGKALSLVATSEKKELSKVASAEKKNFSRETKYAKQKLSFLTKDQEKQDKLLDALGPEAAGALAEAGAAGAAFGAVLIAGAVAATALGIAISTAAFGAGKARDSSKQLIDTLTQGNGVKALALIDKQSQALGVSLQQGRDDFIAFRQAGLDNSQAAALEKLKADLDSVDSSGRQSAEAVSKVLDMKGGKSTAKEIALLAEQAHVAGTGATAAKKNFESFGGAMTRLDNTKTKALEQIFDLISPAINKAASQIATFVEAFAKSEKGQKLIAGIGKAISAVVSLAASALPSIVSGIEGLIDAGKWVYDTYQKVATAFTQSSTAMAIANAAITGLKVIGYALAAALATLVAGAVLLAIPFLALSAAFYTVIGAVAAGLGALWNMVTELPKIGSAIIDGLTAGINSKIASLKATISGIAGSVSGGFKAALGIHSPSTVFAKFGKSTAQGYEQGVERHMPEGSDFASQVTPGGGAAPGPSSSPSAAASGGLSVTIENINVPMGVDPTPFARAVRAEIMLMLQMISLSKGGAPGAVL